MMRRESAPKQRTALHEGNWYIPKYILCFEQIQGTFAKLLEKVSAEGKQFSWPGSQNINIRARYQAWWMNTCTCVHVCKLHACTHVSMYTLTHTNKHTQTYMHTYTNTPHHPLTPTPTHTHIHTHAHTHTHTCTNILFGTLERCAWLGQGQQKSLGKPGCVQGHTSEHAHFPGYLQAQNTHTALKGTPSKEVSWPKHRENV